MERIKFCYYYLFYKIYKHFEKGPSVWLSEWKATLLVDLIFFIIMFLFVIYYNIFVDRNFSYDIENLYFYVTIFYFSLIIVPNYYIFNHKDRWKMIVKEYDKFPKNKNYIGGWVVLIFILLLLSLLLYGYYLMSIIDWNKV